MRLNIGMQSQFRSAWCAYRRRGASTPWRLGATIVAAALLVVQSAHAMHGVAPQPYAGTPAPVMPHAGAGLPTPLQVPGKEISLFTDRNALDQPDAERVVAWDGLGGVRDAYQFEGSATRPYGQFVHLDLEVNALGTERDALFHELRQNRASLLFSVQGEGDISYVSPTGAHGNWARGNRIDIVHPPDDVDGLRVWGNEAASGLADRYSLAGDPPMELSQDVFQRIAVWEYSPLTQESFPHTSTLDLAASIDMLYGGPGVGGDVFGNLMEGMVVNAIMTYDDEVTFSIEPLDLSFLSPPVVFTGGEIFEYHGSGIPATFLQVGGYTFNGSLNLMDEFGVSSNNINALAAIAVPEPASLVLIAFGTLLPALRRRLGPALAAAALKQPRSTFQQLLLPRRHLPGMHAKLAGQLGGRLLATTGRQRHLRLERPTETTSLPSHPEDLLTGHPAGGILYLIRAPSFWGEAHNVSVGSVRAKSRKRAVVGQFMLTPTSWNG